MRSVMHSSDSRLRCLSRLSRVLASLIVFSGILPAPVLAWSWEDLWLTPHQQANRLLENEEYQALTENESKDWQGVGHYQLGDHAAAAENFAANESLNSRYNLGTTLTQAGDYDKAIEMFDSVLEESPDHEKALHNRNIAQQLRELQQQQESQQDDSDQENPDQENSEQEQDNSSSDSQNQESESSQSEQDQDQRDSESQSQENQSDADDSEELTEEEKAQQAQAEEDAAEAENEAQQQAMQAVEEPLSEDQQATEQWLRKIPDDPAGLLRRKLRRNHAAEYPNVVNGESPW